jgi:hypothetical protein
MTLRTKFRGKTKFFLTKKDFTKGNDCVESHTLRMTPCSGDKITYLYTKKCQKCGKKYGTDYPKDNGVCVKCRIKGRRRL